ncbi:MAG: ribonuclease Y [Oscillospiraceae bacterium]|jgi:ribonuclease Y|nr:ribonuclease Y [Oscillospiraceae bacterium]
MPTTPLFVAVIIGVVAIAAGLLIGNFVFRKKGFAEGEQHRKEFAEAHIKSAEIEAERIVAEAKEKIKEGETKVAEAREKAKALEKAALVEAKDEIFKLRADTDREIAKQRQEVDRDLKERRAELNKSERRLQQKEENLDRKTDKFEKMEEQIVAKNQTAQTKLDEAERLRQSQMDVLERISGFTQEQAKEQLLQQLDTTLEHEKALKISSFETRLKDECDDRARWQIALAVSRLSSETVSELAVSVIAIPSDELKGRIIGREGRNIRTLEQLTGVDLIIDDTPEAITISSHDRVRREVARIALETLIQDGRIHPAKIEESVERAQREVMRRIKQMGENAVLDTNVGGINSELLILLGRLHYRTSYSQNVLQHSIEVAHLSGIMAAELGVDPVVARRAGLLHDIGKAFSQEIEGSHVQLGVEVCKKFKESTEVIHAIEAHHGDVEVKTVTAAIVQAADAISAARPGARNENYESYIKRLQKLEEICTSYDGVDKSYAIQAGREVRIMIKPDQISDDAMVILARDIANKIEIEMEYPGQIKVHLIRESRVTDYAR